MPWNRKDAKSPVRTTGLYADLQKRKIDGRTRVGKLLREAREGLAQMFPGGEVNAVCSLLIDRIAYKALKLVLFELQDLKGLPGVTPGSEQRYLQLSNSLREDLRLLVTQAQRQAPDRGPDLVEYLGSLRKAGQGICITPVKGGEGENDD